MDIPFLSLTVSMVAMFTERSVKVTMYYKKNLTTLNAAHSFVLSHAVIVPIALCFHIGGAEV